MAPLGRVGIGVANCIELSFAKLVEVLYWYVPLFNEAKL